eukprot:TRINITY_DN7198_c0_g1_i1.p1 TRINITY_DN7198_c0_g1~~TRINITY_DN7198_c0_g1_i1.p1  ORF type:complete len:195 (+),score=31.98 TRINITY_DN7198_c0_g1_i1:41-625(+)
MAQRPWHGSWKSLRLSAPKTSLIQGGVRKVHAQYNDSVELVEEFDVITDKLLVRKWRMGGKLGGEGKWEYEIGVDRTSVGNEHLMISASSPSLSRTDTAKIFEWRIRNLPYPPDTYSVTVDSPHEITVRTTNKKYFKKIMVPDMLRASLPLTPDSLSWTHAHNTLVISYVKPKEILQEEAVSAQERKTMKTIRA